MLYINRQSLDNKKHYIHEILDTIMSWMTHFAQVFVLLKCLTCKSTTGLDQIVNQTMGTSISETMIFPPYSGIGCVTKYDYLSFFSIYVVFVRFFYNLHYLYDNCDDILYRYNNQRYQIIFKRFITLSATAISLLFFTVANPGASPSNTRYILHILHLTMVGIFVSSSYVWMWMLLASINIKKYYFFVGLHLFALLTIGIVWLIVAVNQGTNVALVDVFNVGEFEIMAFSVVYYVMILINIRIGDIENNPDLKSYCIIFLIYYCIGPLIYNAVNYLIV